MIKIEFKFINSGGAYLKLIHFRTRLETNHQSQYFCALIRLERGGVRGTGKSLVSGGERYNEDMVYIDHGLNLDCS